LAVHARPEEILAASYLGHDGCIRRTGGSHQGFRDRTVYLHAFLSGAMPVRVSFAAAQRAAFAVANVMGFARLGVVGLDTDWRLWSEVANAAQYQQRIVMPRQTLIVS